MDLEKEEERDDWSSMVPRDVSKDSNESEVMSAKGHTPSWRAVSGSWRPSRS